MAELKVPQSNPVAYHADAAQCRKDGWVALLRALDRLLKSQAGECDPAEAARAEADLREVAGELKAAVDKMRRVDLVGCSSEQLVTKGALRADVSSALRAAEQWRSKHSLSEAVAAVESARTRVMQAMASFAGAGFGCPDSAANESDSRSPAACELEPAMVECSRMIDREEALRRDASAQFRAAVLPQLVAAAESLARQMEEHAQKLAIRVRELSVLQEAREAIARLADPALVLTPVRDLYSGAASDVGVALQGLVELLRKPWRLEHPKQSTPDARSTREELRGAQLAVRISDGATLQTKIGKRNTTR